MSLNNFNTATSLMKAMEAGAQYVRVTAGPRKGTVGRVMAVKTKYYSAHDYQLAVKGRRSFWMKGSDLEHLEDWKGGTSHSRCDETPTFNDLMGRQIEVGHTLVFSRRASETSGSEMVMGTVRKISDKGAIYAKLFHSSQGGVDSSLVRVGKPGSAMIIDKGTTDQVMLAKLAAF